MAIADRCGTFPFLNIAEDYGLPYGTVLRYAEGMDSGHATRIPVADIAIVWERLVNAWRIAAFECHVMRALGWNAWPDYADEKNPPSASQGEGKGIVFSRAS